MRRYTYTKTHKCFKKADETAREYYRLYRLGKAPCDIAKDYNVSVSTIQRAIERAMDLEFIKENTNGNHGT